VNRDLCEFQTKTGEEHQLSAMDVDLPSDPLLQLLQEEIFKILAASKGVHDHQHKDTGQHNGTENDETASSNQLLLPKIGHAGGINRIKSADAASYRITCMKSTKPPPRLRNLRIAGPTLNR
jgi:hypothetical protein